jgi:hypothetical protein
VGRAKKLSLKRLITAKRLDVVFIQETMGVCEVIVAKLIKLFPG